eukprot:TRINITY_DN821_c0_g1_i1.p2 TRINITY_DN821_c0_g1~~TRINITY_DN821_c0_g1_i1.p2  ORF type:complete len:74 (+),score=6.41 TRINITY_DN821_c0_g1_i1:115-336(+)
MKPTTNIDHIRWQVQPAITKLDKTNATKCSRSSTLVVRASSLWGNGKTLNSKQFELFQGAKKQHSSHLSLSLP